MNIICGHQPQHQENGIHVIDILNAGATDAVSLTPYSRLWWWNGQKTWALHENINTVGGVMSLLILLQRFTRTAQEHQW